MKILKKIILNFILVAVICLAAAAAYIQLQGKEILTDILAQSFDRSVTIEKLSFEFPLGVSLKNFSVDPVLRADSVHAQIDARSIWNRNLQFASVRLENPKVFWKNSGPQAQPASQSEQQNEPASPSHALAHPREDLVIHNLTISNGSIAYFQDAIQDPGLQLPKDFSFELRDVQLKVHNLVFPYNQPANTKFDLMAKLLKEGLSVSGSTVMSKGWVNLGQKDMEADMMVVDQNGKSGLEAKAISRNNDLEVNGKINIQNFLVGLSGKESQPGDVENLILGALASSGLDIAANFSFKTMMDSFQIENVSFSGSVESSADTFKSTQ